MRVIIALSIALFLCGCMGGAPPPPVTTTASTQPATIITTTSTVPEDFVYFLPSTTSTISAQPPITTLQEGTTDTVANAPASTLANPIIKTFADNGGRICTQDGKPVVRMFSNLGCVHCEWGGPIFDKVVREYSDRGLIVAHHWVFDRDDDALTPAQEGSIPLEESAVFLAGNQTTVPYYNLGCRFTRVGNGYYVQNQPQKEENEFRAVLDQIIADKYI
jgi:hypothetical protein